MADNKVLKEIENVIKENTWIIPFDDEVKEIAEAIYSLFNEVSNDYYNQMKINQKEFGTEARFNHWAKNIYKKQS